MSIALPKLSELHKQEKIIEQGLASFVAVGKALMKIREEELYRADGFEGFVEYLESKPWGIDANYAYKQIQAAQVSQVVPVVQTERQARELAPLLRRATPEVVRQVYGEVVKETNGKPTASAIREKVRPMIAHSRKEEDEERPTQHLPDLLSEDSPRNLRTQLVRWFELGRHIESLLDSGSKLEPQSKKDLQLIKSEIKAMSALVTKLGRKM